MAPSEARTRAGEKDKDYLSRLRLNLCEVLPLVDIAHECYQRLWIIVPYGSMTTGLSPIGRDFQKDKQLELKHD